MKPAIPVVSFVASLCVLDAQSPLSGLAQGLIIEDAVSGRTIERKPPGDAGLLPFPTTAGSAPTYTTTALLHHLGASAATFARRFQMNAISTGNDNIPVSNMGSHWEVTPGLGQGWAVITLSVAQQQSYDTTDPASAFGRRLLLGAPGRGSDVFSYWFAGNVGVPSDLVDAAFFEVGPEHMSLGTTGQVTGLDGYMPAVVEAQGTPTVLMPVLGRWFFALTPESASFIRSPGQWPQFKNTFVPSISDQDIGANYVYGAQWNGSSWSQIEVVFRPWQLGLDANEAIDAIAYFDVPGRRDRIVFSLAGVSVAREQVLIGGTGIQGPQGGSSPLRAQGNTSITRRVGIGNNTSVDSLCTYDPEASTGFCKWMAMPEPNQPPATIGCSAARFRVNATTDGLLLQATDLPSLPGTVVWFVVVNNNPPVLLTQPRTGSREQMVWQLPAATTGTIVVYTFYATGAAVMSGWSLRLQS